MKILGLIPARGGSKGVPKKNIKPLLGKPLIGYTIDVAHNSTLLNKTILSSDNNEIINISKKLGLEVPFVRPLELATDQSSTIDVVIHALKYYKSIGEDFDAVCLLQVTNPFRTANFIDKAIRKFIEAKTDALISVLEVPHEFNPHWVFEANGNENLKISTGEQQIITRRQDLPKAYYRDGSIYITKSDVILNQRSLYGKSISYILGDKNRHVNIDTLSDWEKAVNLVKQMNY